MESSALTTERSGACRETQERVSWKMDRWMPRACCCSSGTGSDRPGAWSDEGVTWRVS